MGRKKWLTLVGLTALILAVAVGLSGCVPIAGLVGSKFVASQRAKDEAAKQKAATGYGEPRAGDCWHASFHDTQFADWTTSKPVRCALPHQLYTYAVTQLSEKHTGPEFANGYLINSVYTDADGECGSLALSRYGAFGKLDQRLAYKSFVPREADWNKGARWVRCDLQLIAIGSNLASPQLANISSPLTILKQLESQSTYFNFCTNDVDRAWSKGPKSTGAVFALCNADPDWTLIARFTMPGTEYPASDAFAAVNNDDCTVHFAKTSTVTLASDPSSAQWKDGDKEIDCWSHSIGG